MKILKMLPILAFSAILAPAAFTSAQAAVRTGTLTCDIAGGVGMVLASSKAVSCRFTGLDGSTELYNGQIRRLGVDVGFTYAGRVIWTVFEPSVGSGALAGTYNGISAEATVGAGLGANVLLGGGNGGVTLQPLSVQGQTGLNVAAGFGSLTIQPVANAVVTDQGPRPTYHRRHKKAHRYAHHGKKQHGHHAKHKSGVSKKGAHKRSRTNHTRVKNVR